MMAEKVLSFMAHPDDAEFMCAGTLARLHREAGCEIAIATATSGDCGSATLGTREIARVRHGEAKAAAAILDADYYCAGAIDLFIMYDQPTLRSVIEILRKAQPTIVITHSPADYMADHENVSRLVRMACFAAPVPNVWTQVIDPADPLKAVPHLYYADPIEMIDPISGQVIEPDFAIETTGVIETKVEMLACHASQRDWLRKHHGMDEYIEIMKRMGAKRGELIGKPFAEGFRQHHGHPYPQNNIIAELLGDAN
jgi:LmbE family N-acetylglucosaminyl deacetylase